MYLANDVIQNSKKKGPEFGKEFGGVLKKAFEHMSSMGYDEKTKGSLMRVLNIWGERGVYDPKQITEFKAAFGKLFIAHKYGCDLLVILESGLEPPSKKQKTDSSNDRSHKRKSKSPHRGESEVRVEVRRVL